MPTTLTLSEMAFLVEKSSGILPTNLQSYHSDVMYYIINHSDFRDNFRFMIPLSIGVLMLKGLPNVEPEVFAEELASFVEVWAITRSRGIDSKLVIEMQCSAESVVAEMLAEIADDFIDGYSHFFKEKQNV